MVALAEELLKRGWAVKVGGSLLPTEHKAKAWPTRQPPIPCPVPFTCFPHHMQPRGRPVTWPSTNTALHCLSSHPTKRFHVSLSDVNHYSRISTTLQSVYFRPTLSPKKDLKLSHDLHKADVEIYISQALENYLLPQPFTLLHFNTATSYPSKFVSSLPKTLQSLRFTQ